MDALGQIEAEVANEAEGMAVAVAPGVGVRAASNAGDRKQQTIIRPRSGRIPVDWPELREFRELLYFLIWRDVKIP